MSSTKQLQTRSLTYSGQPKRRQYDGITNMSDSELDDLKDRVHRLVANEEPYDYGKICEQAAKDAGQEKRQEFMDHIWSGMKLGDAYKAAGISFEAALGTMKRNIENHHTLRRESL